MTTSKRVSKTKKVVREDKHEAAEKWMESMGELFIRERFASVCEDPREIEAVKVERWTDGSSHRLIIDPDCIDKELLTIDRLKADLNYLMELVEKNPRGFLKLADALGDTEKLAEQGIKLGLVEENFEARQGGWAWIVIIPIVLALSGCADDDKPAPKKTCGHKGPQGYLCSKQPHNKGRHKNIYKNIAWR